MDRLVETLRAIARNEVERVMRLQVHARLGNVVEYDPKRHAANVKIQPEGVISNWIPVASEFIGNNFGMVAPLGVGEQVKMVFPEYGTNQAVIVRRLFDQRNQVPKGAQQGVAGEFYFYDGFGSSYVFDKTGGFTLIGKNTIVTNAAKSIDATTPTYTIHGDLHVTGAVIGGYGTGDQVGLQTHTHAQDADSANDTEAETHKPTAGT